MSDTQRNMLILLAIAVAGVVFSGAFGIGAGYANMLLNIAFTVVIVWFLVVLYQRNSGTIAQMPVTPRLVLQAAGIALVAMLATGLLHAPFLPAPFGWGLVFPMVFWPAVLMCGFSLWWAWQQRVTRW
jgi:hypothetical protein